MNDDRPGLDRREALKRMAAAAATAAVVPTSDLKGQSQPPAKSPPAHTAGPRGTPSDPDLVRPVIPWPRLLTAGELQTVAALCDVILPADERSPSASTVGIPAYINEYVSAPYDAQRRELVQIRGGLAWLNTESEKRFGQPFVGLTSAHKHEICDDICYLPNARPELGSPARFFARFRDLTATGYYTTEAGMKDLRYLGNIARPSWDGPPPEVLRHVGLS